jgi:type IV pilus assembly protein PilA
MSKIHTRRGGFTLIELMIVVAIIGILAAIAIPNFLKFQLKAKTSEGKTNLAAIRTAEESVFAEYGAYVSAPMSPNANLPSNVKRAFADVGVGSNSFDGLGWTPEGDIYFVYGVGIDGVTNSSFWAQADGDIDGDTVYQSWGYRKLIAADPPVAPTGIVAAACAFTNLPNEQVGPCEPTFGRSVF